ncbi:acetate kinase [Bariatricus massiliensis]|uniref:Acetate kinase n=1 Tax=Bariatricus massiliensis TaxID=1745713 RepID=A0ABS8DC76_9FIRM|nr:acetate kinase [Bariatricus massiliensis]MCB7303209.1 acetate kinase [Bariatricus massiliensis]MCB7373341.1 acetate kinase [Bariatricus massiliensis]MCB7386011.1 acetate kinase [Bariatricus massiliensis]MCB7410173.1 acetate kinase [Bariatricus massiliensis]MCQ5252543.1 acetate kinase [Bariatricus massiliensis]
MNVLVINCGSSSLKFQLINSDSEAVLAKGLCERIGIDGRLTYQPAGGEKAVTDKAMPTHTEAIQFVIDALTDAQTGVVKSLDEINAVGHRVVHGGENFSKSVVVTEEVKKAIEECNDLAPLHNPANLIGIAACESLMPGTPQVVVFDTAFHQTMPEKAYMYGLPYEYYDKYKVRRYGFHGTSHSFVSKRVAEFLGKPYDATKTIVCHLGNGSSICAVMNGKSVDTSMGLTPLEGLVMGTRSGDIDPAIMEFIAKKENLDIAGIMNVLNKKSGVEGLSGVSSDFRDLDAAAKEGNARAALALEVFAYKVAKYVGSYAAAMNGVDNIVFTAGIGENDGAMRVKICSYLEFLGIKIDEEANGKRGEEIVISTPDSKVTVLVIPTNEELAIARETVALL